MKSYQEIYNFIKKHYKHSRFEARNNQGWGEDYSHRIVASYVVDLEKYGVSHISRHESVTGEGLTFDSNLNFINSRK